MALAAPLLVESPALMRSVTSRAVRWVHVTVLITDTGGKQRKLTLDPKAR